MKLEYLPDGSKDCPLLRLYDFTPAEARQLHDAVAALASGSRERADVHCLQGVKSICECRLMLVVRRWDQALVQIAERAEFECGFTLSTRDNVAGLIEPFMQSATGYQWLTVVPGEARLLLSLDGGW